METFLQQVIPKNQKPSINTTPISKVQAPQSYVQSLLTVGVL